MPKLTPHLEKVVNPTRSLLPATRIPATRSFAFRNLKRPEPLHQTIASQILDEITHGRLVPGDRLPSEHELAGAFDVSRNIVREAIACLRADGVIESRQGAGAFVLAPKDRQAIRIQASALDDQRKLLSLFELRGLLEIEAAGLAAKRRNRSELRAIGDALLRMKADKTMSDTGVDADLEFHHHIAVASRNDYLVEFLDFVGQRIRQTIFDARASNARDEIVATTLSEHGVIHDAIAAGDAEAARTAMRLHIEGAARRLHL